MVVPRAWFSQVAIDLFAGSAFWRNVDLPPCPDPPIKAGSVFGGRSISRKDPPYSVGCFLNKIDGRYRWMFPE